MLPTCFPHCPPRSRTVVLLTLTWILRSQRGFGKLPSVRLGCWDFTRYKSDCYLCLTDLKSTGRDHNFDLEFRTDRSLISTIFFLSKRIGGCCQDHMPWGSVYRYKTVSVSTHPAQITCRGDQSINTTVYPSVPTLHRSHAVGISL